MINIAKNKIAYEYIYNEIMENKIKPGEFLVENEIAKKLSISRTPIREALRDLEEDGLVINYKGKSSIVSNISPTDISEIFDIRISLELLALNKSINRISDDEIDEIIELLKDQKIDFDWSTCHKIDKKLHDLIIKRSANKRLFNIISSLNVQIERFRRIASQANERAIKSINEHIDLAEKIKSRDLDESRKSLTFHLNSVRDSLLEIAIIDSTNYE